MQNLEMEAAGMKRAAEAAANETAQPAS